MLRQPVFPVVLLALWAVSTHHPVADAQIFGRAVLPRPDAAVANSSCGLKPCPPRDRVHGYYPENWRRWPDAPRGVSDEDLSPFANTPKTPGMLLPEPRDEDAIAPRRRTGGVDAGSSTPRTTPPSSPPADPPPQRDLPADQLPGSDLPDSSLPDDLTLPDLDSDLDFPEPQTEAEADSSGGFFPEVDETPAGESEDALPDLDTDQPSPDDTDDLFDLDDFSQAPPRRSHQMRFPQLSQRRATSRGRLPQARSRGSSPTPTQLTSTTPPAGRRNPLRVRQSTTRNASEQRVAYEHAGPSPANPRGTRGGLVTSRYVPVESSEERVARFAPEYQDTEYHDTEYEDEIEYIPVRRVRSGNARPVQHIEPTTGPATHRGNPLR